MSLEKYFDVLFGEIQTPCLLAELDSKKVVYHNSAFQSLISKKQILLGVSCDDLIFDDSMKCCPDCSQNWTQSQVYSNDVYIKRKQLHFTVTNSKMDYMGKSYNLSKFFMAGETSGNGMNFEEALTQCLAIFQKPHEEILVALMELLAKFYGSERAYVYRVLENSKIHCSAEWCSDPEFKVVNQVETRIDAPLMIQWAKSKQEFGVIYVDRKGNHPPESPEQIMLDAFEMENFALGILEDSNKEIIGVVGISNYPRNTKDFRLLRAVTRFVAQNINNEAIESSICIMDKDILTGFSTRSAYVKRLKELEENPPKTLGLLSVDMNGLKIINQTYGNAQGDKHIRLSAQKLKNFFDYEFYRLSGVEFVGIAPDIDKDTFEEQVTKLQDTMRQEENCDFSLGHIWESGNFHFSSMLRDAETMMYINKQEYYHSSQRHFKNIDDNTLSDLLSYLENDEFMIYLQPQINLVDGSLYGAEALIRRFDKTNDKMVFPDQFISLYEQKSVIRHVDIFVVETVCQLLQQWEKLGKAIPISVNLSRVTLMEFGIVDTIVKICDKYQVPHALLVIEVTERVGLIENNVASDLIIQFKQHGFHISLDDFGCAYSNIVTLAQIEVDEVKIDKSLVDDITISGKKHILVKNVLSMCNELEGAYTLAEGIEEEEQANLLLELGCHLGQGYLYSRPIPCADFFVNYMK